MVACRNERRVRPPCTLWQCVRQHVYTRILCQYVLLQLYYYYNCTYVQTLTLA